MYEKSSIKSVADHIPKESVWKELVFIVGQLTGINRNDLSIISQAVHLIFTSCDIHDDLVDGDVLSISRYSEMLSLQTTLLMEGLMVLGEQIPPKYLNCIMASLYDASLGQKKDLSFKIDHRSPIPPEERYFEIIKQKSGNLCKIIAWSVAFSADEKQKKALTNFCENLAISGQLYNDARDISRPEKNDLAALKATLPLIKACKNSIDKGDGFFAILKEFNNKQNHSSRKVLEEYISSSGAIDYTYILSSFYYKKAINELYIGFQNEDAIHRLNNLFTRSD